MTTDTSADPQARRPLSLPENYIYTSCYCEENVYLLAQTFVEQLAAHEDPEWEVYVVLISNDDKTVSAPPIFCIIRRLATYGVLDIMTRRVYFEDRRPRGRCFVIFVSFMFLEVCSP